jgi:hypothetical protein
MTAFYTHHRKLVRCTMSDYKMLGLPKYTTILLQDKVSPTVAMRWDSADFFRTIEKLHCFI